MDYGGLVFGSINIELITEFCQIEEHCLRLILHRSSEEGSGLNDAVDKSLELIS